MIRNFRADFDDDIDQGVDTGDEDLGGEQDYDNGNAVNQVFDKILDQALEDGETTQQEGEEKMFLPPNLKLEKGDSPPQGS